MSEMGDKVKGWFATAVEGVKTAADEGVGFFKKSWVILSLTAALIGAAGYVYYLNSKNEKAQADLEEVKTKMDDLKVQTENVIKINEQNAITVQQLQEDRERMDALVYSFNAQLDLNGKILSKIGDKVGTLEDGKLAPVLRETLREIQTLREQRTQP